MVHKSEETEVLKLNLSLVSELVLNHPAKIPFDHMNVGRQKKVFTFAADCMLGGYAYIYAHIKITKLHNSYPEDIACVLCFPRIFQTTEEYILGRSEDCLCC